MKQRSYFRIISGEQSGCWASLLRANLLGCAAWYSVAMRVRNELFRRGVLRVQRVNCPVISVGNLTTGGTGKTPMVAWLVNWLKAQQRRPGIVSRGYKSLDSAGNDERRLLEQLCPGVLQYQDKQRYLAASQLLAESDTDVIVLDDGFQHRWLARDCNLVLIDALNPWGYGHLLPRGLLREPLSSLRRADALIVTRANLAAPETLADIIYRIRRQTSAPLFRTAFQPSRLVNWSGANFPLSLAAERRVAAVCAIGNPSGFRRTLASMAAPVSEKQLLTFPDHHHYSNRDVEQIERWSKDQGSELLLTTRKDLVKLQRDRIGLVPLMAVDIELEFLDSKEEFTAQLQAVLSSTSART